MFSKETLDFTVQKLGKIKDNKLEKYVRSTHVFNDFIELVKRQPPERQLKFIQDNFDEQVPKKINHFLFCVAAIIARRTKNLPDDHPEKQFIDLILSYLGDGIIKGFTTVGLPKLGLINKIQVNLEEWIKSLELQAAQNTSHETLLVSYCTICFFESLVPDSFADKKKALANIKQEIAEKFNKLVQNHNHLLKTGGSSHNGALQQLTPELRAKEQFQTNLLAIKEREAKIQRMVHLKGILSGSSNNVMKEFWANYQTQEQFNQLMDDLEIEAEQKQDWQSFFDEKYADGFAKIKGGFFVVMPKFLGGTSTNILPLKLIDDKADEALKKLGVNLKEYKDPTKLIAEITAEFNQLKELEKKDIQTIKEHQAQIKSAKGITVSTDKILDDIEEFRKHLIAQEKYVLQLQKIHTKILALDELGIKTDGLVVPFEIMLDHAVKTVTHGDKKIDPLMSPQEKMDALLNGISDTQEKAQEIKKNIIEDVQKIELLIDSKPKKDSLLHATELFIQKYEKNFLHKILCLFSKTYNEMFKSLSEAVTEKNTTRIASILVGKAEEYPQTHTVAMWFDEAQELQTLKTPAKS
ncbi:hypothetical protein FOLKNPGA_02362 [Legionella sp. PC1000]|uniref:hypothetical protein n=1 Tax=Legionella sp. PC1000 TaxID=2746060 RepID=UPI0015F7877B|nr:hypothetical protein [Legionella sp. PC1000]QLZ69568.1 hypothetical protein FOLKNPGA_02362 [Legionella sp. PC1000]